ncbi:acyl-CoA N-acyltransferase [Teratosphaeria nubilosa]|uniref:Acyl-CoA N-acyltransferase n=1 Tax=Teratosphaeria nubilosa TaxID=161662 RepID=A0A6G1LHZ9_9PEZI|nr:acyl-CoA N-acyltransferase [Teratosphaeria nubilosa]
MDPTRVSIKHATSDDVPIILDMIKELAAFLESLDKVEATEDSLKRTLSFAPGGTQHCNTHGYAKTLILRLPREPPNEGDEPEAVAGMAMYFNNYSTWQAAPGIYLEDLFVRTQYRKRGYGKLLIRALAQEVLQIGGTRLEWSCLKRNEASLEFYERLGARQKGEWVGLRVEGGDMPNIALNTEDLFDQATLSDAAALKYRAREFKAYKSIVSEESAYLKKILGSGTASAGNRTVVL